MTLLATTNVANEDAGSPRALQHVAADRRRARARGPLDARGSRDVHLLRRASLGPAALTRGFHVAFAVGAAFLAAGLVVLVIGIRKRHVESIDRGRRRRSRRGARCVTTVLRADAQRNLVRVLDAAREVFAEQGIDAPVTEIADRAGVGVGTIFRRFPTKDDLLVAVVEQRTQQLIEAADLALESPDPGAALRGFMETATAMQISDVCWCDAGADLFEREGIRELIDVLVGKIGELLTSRADRRPDSVRRAGTRYSRAS